MVEAVRHAAPLILGRVGAAAGFMAAECETGGLVEAATRFAATIRRPLAEMLATVLAEAFQGARKWVGLAGVLADEAAEAADTARHFHRHVAALMPQIAVTVVMAMGCWPSPDLPPRDVGQWLTSPVGRVSAAAGGVDRRALRPRAAPAWRMGR